MSKFTLPVILRNDKGEPIAFGRASAVGRYIIKDWAGNHLFQDLDFDSFEDAWDFLYERFEKEAEEDERYFEDYYVEIKD